MAETTDTTVTGDSLIGDVIEQIPGAADVIEKYFGDGCFTCPGIRVESINFGATMHGIDAGEVVAELNALVR
jgi:hybrid cluster-associated redox disulfide protein